MTTSTILAVIDPTAEQQPALQRAALLARKSKAGLKLLICDYDPDIDAGHSATVWIRDQEPPKDHLIGIYEKKLEGLAAPLRDTGIDTTIKVRWEFPLHEGILHEIQADPATMVFKDTHHHNLLKRTVITNTDWYLIRQCPVPLYLAKPRELPRKPIVFAAVDPLHHHDKPASLDHAILGLAQEFSDRYSGELHVVHTYALPSFIASVPVGPSNVSLESLESKHRREVFDRFVSAYELPEGRAHFMEGLPEHKLPELTSVDKAGLIVMGAVSRRGLDRLLVGSTAERVLDRLGCDLLVVKPPSVEGRGNTLDP